MTSEIQTVAHYTSGAELISMIEKGIMWATAIQFMNDSAEFALGLELAQQAVEDLLPEHDQSQRRELESMARKLDEFRDYPIYITCFSEAIDSISQWRSYSQSNLGYALEFDLEALRRHACAMGFQFVPCIYNAHDWIAIWKQRLADRLADNAADGGCASDLNRCLSECVQEIVANSARLKHAAFSAEQEWRMVGVKGAINYPEKFRVGRSYLIPYMEVPLPLRGEQCLLKTIRIGPTPSRREARLAVQTLVQAGGSGPKIALSNIPYRDY